MSRSILLPLAFAACASACGEPLGPVAPAEGRLVLGALEEDASGKANAPEAMEVERLARVVDAFFEALDLGAPVDDLVVDGFSLARLLPEDLDAHGARTWAGVPSPGVEFRLGHWADEPALDPAQAYEPLARVLEPLDGPREVSVNGNRDALLARGANPEAGVAVHVGWCDRARTAQVRILFVAKLEGERLARLVPLALVEHRVPQPLFADVSSRVFGVDPGYVAEALAGIDGLLYRRDVLMNGDRFAWHGVAVGDADGDGREDLYLSQPAGLPNRLLLRQSDGSVKDATTSSRVGVLEETLAALFVNLDEDEDQDLVIALGPGIATATNRGFGTFDNLQAVRAPGEGAVVGLAVGDADGDGDLDIYGCRYSKGGWLDVPLSGARADSTAARDALFLNEEGVFREATEELGLLAGKPGFSRAALFQDVDEDGDQDLWVARDFGPDVLLRAEVDDSAARRFTRVPSEVAGSNALVPDVFTAERVERFGARAHFPETHFLPAVREPNTWTRWMPGTAGLEQDQGGGPGFASDLALLDVLNRGALDRVSTRGLLTAPGRPARDRTYLHEGAKRTGAEILPAWARLRRQVSAGDALFPGSGGRLQLGESYGWHDATWVAGLGSTPDGRAVAVLDWDDDGRQDLVFRSRCAPRWQLFRNQVSEPGNFVALKLTGTGKNRDALGAVVTLRHGDLVQRRTIVAGGSPGQDSKRLHFGVGELETIERIEIRWPDGSEDVLENRATNTRYDVRQGDVVLRRLSPQPADLMALEEPELGSEAEAATRVPLAEKLPLGPLRYRGFDGSTLPISDLEGAPVLFVLLELGAPETQEILAYLQAERSLVERGALRIVPLVIGAEGETARRQVYSFGYMVGAGVADAGFLESLGALIEAVIGEAPSAPLPLSFLVDRLGQLTCLYFEAPDLDVILPDAESVWRMRAQNLAATRLMNGLRLMGRQRDLRALAERLQALGHGELASFYGSLRR